MLVEKGRTVCGNASTGWQSAHIVEKERVEQPQGNRIFFFLQEGIIVII